MDQKENDVNNDAASYSSNLFRFIIEIAFGRESIECLWNGIAFENFFPERETEPYAIDSTETKWKFNQITKLKCDETKLIHFFWRTIAYTLCF